MKKVLAIVLCFALLLTIVACATDELETPVVTESPTATVAPATVAPVATTTPTEAPVATETPEATKTYNLSVGGSSGSSSGTSTTTGTYSGLESALASNSDYTYNVSASDAVEDVVYISDEDYTGTITLVGTSEDIDINVNVPNGSVIASGTFGEMTVYTASTSFHMYGKATKITGEGGRIVLESSSVVEEVTVKGDVAEVELNASTSLIAETPIKLTVAADVEADLTATAEVLLFAETGSTITAADSTTEGNITQYSDESGDYDGGVVDTDNQSVTVDTVSRDITAVIVAVRDDITEDRTNVNTGNYEISYTTEFVSATAVTINLDVKATGVLGQYENTNNETARWMGIGFTFDDETLTYSNIEFGTAANSLSTISEDSIVNNYFMVYFRGEVNENEYYFTYGGVTYTIVYNLTYDTTVSATARHDISALDAYAQVNDDKFTVQAVKVSDNEYNLIYTITGDLTYEANTSGTYGSWVGAGLLFDGYTVSTDIDYATLSSYEASTWYDLTADDIITSDDNAYYMIYADATRGTAQGQYIELHDGNIVKINVEFVYADSVTVSDFSLEATERINVLTAGDATHIEIANDGDFSVELTREGESNEYTLLYTVTGDIEDPYTLGTAISFGDYDLTTQPVYYSSSSSDFSEATALVITDDQNFIVKDGKYYLMFYPNAKTSNGSQIYIKYNNQVYTINVVFSFADTLTVTATTADMLANLLTSASNIAIDADFEISADTTVPAGTTLTINKDVAVTKTGTITNNGTIVVNDEAGLNFVADIGGNIQLGSDIELAKWVEVKADMNISSVGSNTYEISTADSYSGTTMLWCPNANTVYLDNIAMDIPTGVNGVYMSNNSKISVVDCDFTGTGTATAIFVGGGTAQTWCEIIEISGNTYTDCCWNIFVSDYYGSGNVIEDYAKLFVDGSDLADDTIMDKCFIAVTANTEAIFAYMSTDKYIDNMNVGADTWGVTLTENVTVNSNVNIYFRNAYETTNITISDGVTLTINGTILDNGTTATIVIVGSGKVVYGSTTYEVGTYTVSGGAIAAQIN